MNQREFLQTYFSVRDSLPEEMQSEFDIGFANRRKNPVHIFGFSFWLGIFGVDRFMLGQTWLGVLKLITFGGLYIWSIVDLFLVAGKARDLNAELVHEIKGDLTYTGRVSGKGT